MAKNLKPTLSQIAGKRIAELREQRKWNQTELGDKIKVGQKRISEIERGTKSITLRTLDRIAEALEVDAFALLIPEPSATPAEVNRRKILAQLDKADDTSKDFLLRVMESFVHYQRAPRA